MLSIAYTQRMKDKITTIPDLAVMVKRGFDDVTSRMASKEDVNELRTEMNQRFDRVENYLLAGHKIRIEKLEQEVKELKELLAV